MYQLSEEHIESIEQRILRSGLNNTALQQDLLDHYCCYIEEQMSEGKDFETAYNIAYQAITPDGAQDIETELILLLTINKQIGMKRLLYSFGFLAAFFISVGLTFKIMSWPGASIILFSGFAALFISVIVLLVNAMQQARNHSTAYNTRIIIGILSGVLIAAGSMFKILYYPGANILTLLGMISFSLLFLPMFFYQLYNKAIAV